MAKFMERYGTEDKCHAALVASRWPTGCVCPECECTHHNTFDRNGLLLALRGASGEDCCNLRYDLSGHQSAVDDLGSGYASAELGQELMCRACNSNVTWGRATNPLGCLSTRLCTS